MELNAITHSEEALESAVEGLLSFKDKNFAEGLPIYSFWS